MSARHFDSAPVDEQIRILEHRLASWQAPLPAWLAPRAPKVISDLEAWIERLKASR